MLVASQNISCFRCKTLPLMRHKIAACTCRKHIITAWSTLPSTAAQGMVLAGGAALTVRGGIRGGAAAAALQS